MSYSIHGQNTKILNAKDGLPQSFVSGLIQGRDGDIWVSTRNGLARFDGKKFTRFKHEPGKRSSIAANTIISMQKDGDGNIWIEYESSAIDKISLLTGKITHYSYSTLPLQMVRKGWFITSGKHLVVVLRTGGIQMHKISNSILPMVTYESLGGKMAKGFCEDSKGRLWVLTESGIARLNKSGKLDKFFPSPRTMVFPVQATSDINIIDLHERLNGDLIWGDGKNIYVFNPVRQNYQIVPLPVQSSTGILYIERNPADSSDYFECEGTIYRLDELQVKEIYTAKDIKKGGIRAFIVDTSGMLWIGTNSKGIFQVDFLKNFNASNYNKDFLSDILHSEFGLAVKFFDWNETDTDFSLPGYHLRSRYDSKGRLWLALKRTVCYYETGKGIVTLPNAPPVPYSEGPIPIKGITFLGQDMPLVGYSNGDLFYYDIKGGWQPYLQGLRKSSGLKILVQDILADNTNIWMSTAEHGLICINRTTKKIKRIAVAGTSSDKIHLLGIEQIPTTTNNLWISSYSGLIRFDKTNCSAHLFNQKQGLPDNTVYSVIADNAGTLWLTTNNGIVQFYPRDYRSRTFTVADGLPENEFNRFHHLKLPNGDIALGSTMGMVKFNPNAIKEVTRSPEVGITNIVVDNYSYRKEHQFHNPIALINDLKIKHGQRLVLDFGSIPDKNPENVIYRYKMVGYDTEWVVPGQSTMAHYQALPSGNYVFKVSSKIDNLSWSKNKELIITVQPPWYFSWYSYIVYCCFGIGLAAMAFIEWKRHVYVDYKNEVQLHNSFRVLPIGAKAGMALYLITIENTQHILNTIDQSLDLSNLPPHTEVSHSQDQPRKEFLQNVCDIIDQHMEDESFSTDKLSLVMHIGRTTLHRKMKNFTGMATAEFILGYRLQRAAILLESGYTVSECAYKTGFTSPAYFTKRFKSLYAMTPTQFIAAKQQK